MGTNRTIWLSALLLITAVMTISCLSLPISTTEHRAPAHSRYSFITTHSIEVPLIRHPSHNRAQRDVPASSYSYSLPDSGPIAGDFPVFNFEPETSEETEQNDYNGKFSYSFNTPNGISVEMKGYPKTLSNGMVVQVMEGQYSYTAPDGTPITTRWYADETGFHAEGAHIPGSTGRI